MSEASDRFKSVFDRILDSDAMREHLLKRWRASWGEQHRIERSRRLKYITELSIELAEVKKKTIQATRLADMAIEGVILGDKGDIEMAIDILTFKDDGPGPQAIYEPIYRRYVEIAREALLTWPKEGAPPPS